MKKLITIQLNKGKFETFVCIQQHGKYGKLYIVINNKTVYTGENIDKVYKKIIANKFQFSKSFLRVIEIQIETNRKYNLPLKGKTVITNNISYYQSLGYFIANKIKLSDRYVVAFF